VRASGEIVIERPPEAVWEWATDPRHWEQWQEGVTEVTVDEDLIAARHAYGNRADITVYEVVESRPPQRHVVRSVTEGFGFEGTIELSETVGGTRVRYTVDSGANDPVGRVMFAVARPLVRRSMRRQIAGQLERLKEMAELGGVL
jgi:carbon monoxide dehydrogenase subunit G